MRVPVSETVKFMTQGVFGGQIGIEIKEKGLAYGLFYDFHVPRPYAIEGQPLVTPTPEYLAQNIGFSATIYFE